MKCVKKDAVVKRVQDDQAVQLVKNGWAYCPKSEWKGKKDKAVEPSESEKTAMDDLNKKKNPKKGGKKSTKVKKETKATSGGSNTPESQDAPSAPSKGQF